MKKRANFAAWMGAIAIFASISGCATRPDANPADPWEPMNRSVFGFNQAVDDAVLRPVATAYVKHVPEPVRIGTSNFFSNLTEPWNLVNNVLQGRIKNAGETITRFSLNTVFGVFGLVDVATDAGIERHNEDFGQTLGVWGVPPGPYVVLPLLGPATVRDGSALVVDYQANPVLQLDSQAAQNTLALLLFVDRRALLLKTGNLLDEAALDKYSFSRDVYLQYRRAAIRDSNSNAKAVDEERYDLNP
jgi:phospholipid-binding lipoprotein MlaA